MHQCSPLDCIAFGTLHQFLTKTTPSNRCGYRKGSHMQPSRPNISEQSAQYLTVFVSEKESDRIPFSLSCGRNVVIIDYRLYEVAHVGGGVGIEYYGSVAHKNGWETER